MLERSVKKLDKLVESLMEELNCNTVFTIPLFGGIDVLESVVVTWIIMAIIMAGSLVWVHGLRVRKISGKQAALESGFSFLYRFFPRSFRRRRKRLYPLSDHRGHLHSHCQYDWSVRF